MEVSRYKKYQYKKEGSTTEQLIKDVSSEHVRLVTFFVVHK